MFNFKENDVTMFFSLFYLFAVIWKDLDLPGLPKVIPTYIVLSIGRENRTFSEIGNKCRVGDNPKGKTIASIALDLPQVPLGMMCRNITT